MTSPHGSDVSLDTRQQFAALIASIDGIVWEADAVSFQMHFVSDRAERLLGYPTSHWLRPGFWADHLHPEDREWVVAFCRRATAELRLHDFEYRMLAADGRVVWLRDIVTVVAENGAPAKLRGVMVDVSEKKQGESAQQEYIRFLESMDRINRAIQRSGSLEELSENVLDTVIDILDCDRAWLLAPTSAEAKSWRVVMERNKPEYPGAGARNATVAVDDDIAAPLRQRMASGEPVTFGPNGEFPLTADACDYGAQSGLAMLMLPKADHPYSFGLHQCSHARGWQAHELRLFREIGRRITDALTTTLMFRRLRDSEARFRMLVDHATDAFFLHDADCQILDANHQATQMLGYEHHELVGMDCTDFDPELDHAQLHARRARLDAGEVLAFDTRHRRKDGTMVPVEVRIRPFWEGGKRFAVSLTRDITERRRTDESLRESERRLAAAQGLANVGWWERDYEADRSRLSDVALRIFGLGPERSGLPLAQWDAMWRRLIHPEDRERAVQAAQAALRGGPRYDVEYRVIQPGGDIRVVHSLGDVTHAHDGRPLRWFGTMQDITDLRRAEDELRASEARFRTFVDHATDAFFLHGPGGRVLDVNRQACESLGYRREELIGLHPHEFDAALDQRAMEAVVARLNTGEVFSFETRHRHKDGTVFPVEIRVRPFWLGQTRHSVSLARDITERRRLEEQLRQAQKMEAVGQLAGGVAHDFNNLLTVITGYGQLLLAELSPGDHKRAVVTEILAAGERAANLTRQLLAFSRKQLLQPRTVDLNAVLDDVAKMLRRLIGENTELVLHRGRDLWLTTVDPDQFQQAVINMVVNARDAMPNGGRITIATENDAGRGGVPARDTEERSGPHVVIAVHDTGHGMDEATKAHIFEPFFTTKEPGKGTGLGLAMVYGFVKQSGGHVEVASRSGEGTTFRVYLPRSVAPASRLPAANATERALPTGTETVLLVEDEESVRALTHTILRACGYVVLEARDGEDGLAQAQRHEGAIDLLITDLMMPRMNGRRLADLLLGTRPDLRVLFLSGYSEDVALAHGVRDGELAFLQKPFTPPELARKVRELLDTPRSR